MMTTYILTTTITFISISAMAWGFSGLLTYFFPFTTFRMYRRIFIDITYISSATLGIMLGWSLKQGQHIYRI